MLKVLQNLMQVQSVDVRLNAVRARLAIFPKRLAEFDARVAGARAEVDHSKAAQLATIKERKTYELDVEQWKEKVRKYRDQTSQIKTNEATKPSSTKFKWPKLKSPRRKTVCSSRWLQARNTTAASKFPSER